MRILLLSNIKSTHTIRWATGLAERGEEVIVAGLEREDEPAYKGYENILPIPIDVGVYPDGGESRSLLHKSKILKAVKILKQIIAKYKPDILHAHYASHYGLIAALTKFHPYILSVWGDDITVYPGESILHNFIIRFNLFKADKILATSQFLAGETQKYTSKEIIVTPFGVDTEVFRPMKVSSFFDENDLVIGTVKSLETIYGVDDLVKAFNILVKKLPDKPIKLLIVGDGSQRENLQKLVNELNLHDKTFFAGHVSVEKLPEYHNMLDIFVALSHRESFGVSALEAEACEKPVVVSDVGGFKEVVVDGETGFRVPPESPEKAAEAIERLIIDEKLRRRMGKKGRKWVLKNYDKEKSLDKMIRIYEEVVKK